MIGQRVHQYRIEDLLGRGAMGEVFLAEDTDLDRRVALKFLSPRAALSDEAHLRFEREARAVAALNHPNIVSILEIGEFEGRPFLVMPHTGGETVDAILARGPLPLDRALSIAGQAALGLGWAHEAGIVHRDIKPANLLVTESGVVKILDFGIAMASADTRITADHSSLGTVHYMSPEQARGEEVDGRSDIFSLGSVLYEMLTGKLPFGGDRPSTILYAIETREPRNLRQVDPSVPAAVAGVVQRMLAKDPAQRFATAGEVAEALGVRPQRGTDATQRIPVDPSPPVRSRRRGPLGGAIALFGLLVVAGVLWWSNRSGAPPGPDPPGRTMIVVLPFENLGSPEDDYLADGITQEITSRLASIPELGVISRSSAQQYRGTEKTAAEIGRELNVTYLLEGTVRWDRSGERELVRITPQLIHVAEDRHLWAEPFQREVDDLFAVQSEIAERVGSQLGLRLLASTREELQAQPTDNLEAYQAFLRGMEAARTTYTQETLGVAATMLERAVSLDPQFALAHAELSKLHARIYHLGIDRSPERIARAERAGDTALRLDPDLVEARLARAYFQYWIHKDYRAALEELERARAQGGAEGATLEIRGYILRRQGHYAEAAESLERAFELSPRDGLLAVEVANTNLGRWEFSRADDFYRKAIALEPDRASIYTLRYRNRLLWDGDLAAAGAILASMPAGRDIRSVWFRAFHDLCREDPDAVLARLEPRRGEIHQTHAQTVPFALMLAWAHQQRGDEARARAAFAEAAAGLESQLAEQPDDFRLLMALALARAGEGRPEEALRRGQEAVTLYPLDRDAWAGPILQRNHLFLLAHAGERDAALEKMAALLAAPNPGASPALFRIEPRLAGLRDHPRFPAILEAATRPGG